MVAFAVAEDEPTARYSKSFVVYTFLHTSMRSRRSVAVVSAEPKSHYPEVLFPRVQLRTMGSPEMKLEHTFRMMALKIADQLSLDDCRKIAYVSAGMDDQVALPYSANFRLHVLTTLESRGLITPTKLDFLEDILRNLQRNDLLQLIEDYKKTREYKKAMKRNKKLREQNGENCTCTAAILHPSHDKDQYEKLYAEFLTQFSKLSTSMRVALETNDLLRMKLSFSAVAASTRKLSDTVRKTVSEIDSYSSCRSSRESSGAHAAGHMYFYYTASMRYW